MNYAKFIRAWAYRVGHNAHTAGISPHLSDKDAWILVVQTIGVARAGSYAERDLYHVDAARDAYRRGWNDAANGKDANPYLKK